MQSNSSSSLPDSSSWRFDEIAASDSHRASSLEKAGSDDALVESVKCALQDALGKGDRIRFGREHLEANWDHIRAVVQFQVGAKLFDWFFNASTGYRAHFRSHYKCGLRFNNQIVAAIASILDSNLPEAVRGYELSGEFRALSEIFIGKRFIMRSLAPTVTKIWFCGNRIAQIETTIQPCYGGPKLMVGDNEWSALFYADDKDAWLDVKGGFLGKARPYQVKNPFKRAKELQNLGTA